MPIKITDLVDPNEIEKLKQLDVELTKVLDTYTKVAKDLAKGLEISVSVVGDIDRLEKILVDKGKEATNVQQQLTTVIEEQGKVIANTTNTISRQLMEQERVNKTQRDAYTEYERVKKLLDQYHDTYEGQIGRLVQLNALLEANKKAQKDNEKALSMGRMSMAQYQAKQAELIAQHRSLTQEKRTLTQLMTAEEKAAQSQEGSYAHMSQQLELLKKAYKDLNEDSRDSEFGKELEAAIQNLDVHLKDMAADMGEFQRNVGNYAVANGNLKKKYEELIGTLAALQSAYGKMSEADKASVEGQKLAASIDEVSAAAKETKKTLVEQSQAVEEARRSLEGTSGTTTSVKRDLKELVLEIANLSIEYQNLSEEEKNSAEGQALAEHIRDLTEKAGVLRDAIADTNAAINNAASDTRGFDQLSGTIQLAIDGFGLAQGAAAMLGISEEELAEIQTKLQAAIAASNAMQSIQNNLQKQSAIMQGAALLQTRLRTAAENMHTAAQGKGVIATKAATIAQWAFNAAANANPIGLICAGIIATAGAIYGLVKAINVFSGANKDATESVQRGIEKVDSMTAAHEQLIASLEQSGTSWALVSRLRLSCMQSELKVLERLHEEAVKGNADAEVILETEKRRSEQQWQLLENFEKDVQKLREEVLIQAREDLKEREGEAVLKRKLVNEEIEGQKILLESLKEVAKENGWVIAGYESMLEALEKKRARAFAEIDADETKAAEEKRKKAAEEAKRLQEEANRNATELRKEVQAGEDAMLNIITNSLERQRAAENLSYNRKLKDLVDRFEKTKSTDIELRTALNNQIEGLTAEHNRKMQELELACNEHRLKTEADLISSHLGYVKEGSQEEYEWKRKQLNNQYAMELLAIQKSEAAQTVTVEQAEELRTNLSLKYARLREDAEQEHATKMAELIEKRYADERNNQDNAYISDVNALKQRYAQELAAAKGNVAEQEAIRAKFEQEQARLSREYAQQTARDSIAMLEEVLENEQLSAEDRLKYEQALAKAKVDLETAMADGSIEQIERITEADNKAREQRQANAQQWLQMAADSLNTINELVATVYDAKIAKVEEEQEVNTAAGEAEQERISELVEKKVITEEEGEARKRAAEAQTAKKNEELEKKKQQLKHKQAVWDKANSVAQAGISTALAIMNMMKSAPWPINIAMAAIAGAMGAVQVATILATPIPKYAKGTDRHKGGPAIVGDGGVPELVIFGDKSWVTPDTPTIVDLPAGAIVKPNIDGIDNNAPGLTPLPISGENGTPIIIHNDYKRLEDKMDTFIFIMRRHSNRQHQNAIHNFINRYITGSL